MSAQMFVTVAEGLTLHAAFAAAVAEAQWEHGHGGCTGTIAEKDSVCEISPLRPQMSDNEKLAWALSLLTDEDAVPRALDWVLDKWSPAAALKLSQNRWVFFGWAPA
ncbi:hypothetical protein [Sulfobacillus thermosulfidooxidans]|uniref:hypothetical protein n=1 Tax=Sulfobacillus thermosulfidooxidans TaxID=28034 RepID=UPI0006B4F497|nr:hypothetical protein [Sulfobacillus thermosulfidooxidans]